MKVIAILILSCLVAVPAIAETTTVLPEVSTAIELSSSDVNRISCSSPIQDVVFSEEKDIMANFIGNDAYVKFKVKKRGQEMIYASEPTELFVICGDSVYTLIASPRRIRSQTIRLAPDKKNSITSNVLSFRSMPYEQKMLKILKQAYTDDFPDSYKIEEQNRPFNFSQDLKVTLKKTIKIEGTGFVVKVFEVVATPPTAQDVIELDEKDFLQTRFGKKIAAVAIEEPVLNFMQKTRLFIVDKVGDAL